MTGDFDEERIRIADSLNTARFPDAEKTRARRRPILLSLDELRTESPSKTANLIREAVRRTVHQTRRDSRFDELADLPILERAFAEEMARWQLSHPLPEQGDHFFIEAFTPNLGVAGDQIAVTLRAKPNELHDLVVEYLDDTGTVLGSSDLIVTGRTGSVDTYTIQGTTVIPYLDNLLQQATTVYIRVAAVWVICTEATGVVHCITLCVRRTETVPFAWDIAVPEIIYFEANGESPEITVCPGQTFYLSWHAQYLNKVDIVRMSNQGPNVDYHDDFSSLQSSVQNGLVVDPFSEDYPVDAEYEFTASSPGGSVSATVRVLLRSMPDLSVHGLEVTQAIQYYRSIEHLTDLRDIQPDNSIPLIEGKEAWVRVYLRSGQNPGFDGGLLRDVGGQVELYSLGGSSGWTCTAVLDPIDPSATIPVGATHPVADPNHSIDARHARDYEDERGDIDSTLNFLIPADAVTAPMIRLKAVVSAKTSAPGTSATKEVKVAVVCTPPLRIRAVLVECIEPSPTGPVTHRICPPGDEIATIEDLLSYTRAIYPIRDDVDIVIAGTVTIPCGILDDQRNCDGCCTPNWMWLNGEVAKVAASDGNHPDWLYYGFVPTEAGGSNVPGCSSGSFASGITGSQVTLAHELGHLLGLMHAPFGNVGKYDSAYPAYEPYELAKIPTASIGEFGFDIREAGEVKPPASWLLLPGTTRGFRDFMSYEAHGWRWISLWNFWLMFSGLWQKLGNSSSGGGSQKSNIELTQFIPHLYISGMLTEDGQFDVRCLLVLETGQVPTKHVIPDVYVALLDKEDELVAKAPVIGMPSYGDNHAWTDISSVERSEVVLPIPFHSTVPFKKDAVTVQIRRKGEVVWERRGIKTSKLELITSKSTKNNKLNLTWRYEGEKGGELETWVRWSEDAGRTWNGLAVGIKESTASLRIHHLPKGEIVYQILTSDGFNTASVTTDPISR